MPTILNQESGHHYGTCYIKDGINLICVKDNMKDVYRQRCYVGIWLFSFNFFKPCNYIMVNVNES